MEKKIEKLKKLVIVTDFEAPPNQAAEKAHIYWVIKVKTPEGKLEFQLFHDFVEVFAADSKTKKKLLKLEIEKAWKKLHKSLLAGELEVKEFEGSTRHVKFTDFELVTEIPESYKKDLHFYYQ